MNPAAIVIDFDGTIIDTEWPEYLKVRAAFADHVGASLLPIDYAIGDPVLAAMAYDRALQHVFGDGGPGLVLLGIGASARAGLTRASTWIAS